MTDPKLLFVDVELLQHKLKIAQENILELKAKINQVPPEKIIKYISIGAAFGIAIYMVYMHFQEEKNCKLK